MIKPNSRHLRDEPSAYSSDLRLTFATAEWPGSGRHTGGVGRYLYRLAEALKDHVQLTVVVPPGSEAICGVHMVEFSAPRGLGRFGRYYVAPLRMGLTARRTSADVVHVHGDDLMALVPQQAALVRTYYGTPVGEADSSSSALRRLNHLVLAGVERIARRRYSAAIAIGPDSEARYQADALVPPVLPGGALVAHSQRRSQVVFIGTYDSKKRGDLALATVERVRRLVPDLTYVVVGPRSDAPLYPAWVDFRAGLSDGEVSVLLGESDVLLAPSSYEGFGIPAWEALAHGVLVVGSPNPGMSFIANGGYMRLVDDAQLAPTLYDLLIMEDERRRSFRALARERAAVLAEAGSPMRLIAIYKRVFEAMT
jgi:phosphatidylinositol alpha-mannosyltransferase